MKTLVALAVALVVATSACAQCRSCGGGGFATLPAYGGYGFQQGYSLQPSWNVQPSFNLQPSWNVQPSFQLQPSFNYQFQPQVYGYQYQPGFREEVCFRGRVRGTFCR